MKDHPYRLRRIELRDFKSVAHADITLRPLSVVVGANSSGKSTLLQSILAVAQAVRSDVNTAEFPLNGEFARLGTFDETHNFQAQSDDTPMEIAFELAGPRRRIPSRLANRGLSEAERYEERQAFSWRALLDGRNGDGAQTSGFARLVGLQLEVSTLERERGDDSVRQLTCDISRLGTATSSGRAASTRWRRPAVDLARIARAEPGSAIAPRIEADGRVVDWTGGDSAPIDAAVLLGCLPVALLHKQTVFDGTSTLWWDVATDFLDEDINEERQRLRADAKQTRDSHTAATVAATQIRQFSEKGFDDGPYWIRGERITRAIMRDLGSLADADRREVARSLAELDLAKFRRGLREELSNEPWLDEIEYVDPPGSAGEIIGRFGVVSQRTFREDIRYLGPLREAPHVLYDPGPSKLDLGVGGEYAAAVLRAQADTDVLMPEPEGNGTRRKLNEALDFWLQEFGLADNAHSRDQGRMGIALSVTPTGSDREVDLTSVGVGVSQVLPVILLCLLAEPGTLVILEQPELHLHPKLQQDLADFLLACTRAGRQLVIETHSEHLVNRLRYHIAADEGDESHELIRLIFAENDEGITSYREPEINTYGGLGDDWPAGFLDLTAKQSQDLVRQALAKRKRDEQATADS